MPEGSPPLLPLVEGLHRVDEAAEAGPGPVGGQVPRAEHGPVGADGAECEHRGRHRLELCVVDVGGCGHWNVKPSKFGLHGCVLLLAWLCSPELGTFGIF